MGFILVMPNWERLSSYTKKQFVDFDEWMLLALCLKMWYHDRNTNGKKQHVQNKLAL
jgi:hypothetical protein